MSADAGVLPVGAEPPPLDGPGEGLELPPLPTRDPKGRGKTGRGVAAGRFQVLNAFVDGTLRDLSRSDIAAWLVLYRDTRDGLARVSFGELARRGGMGRRTAYRAVRRLVRRGLVQVVRQGGLNRGPSVYRVRGA